MSAKAYIFGMAICPLCINKLGKRVPEQWAEYDTFLKQMFTCRQHVSYRKYLAIFSKMIAMCISTLKNGWFL